VKWPGHQSVDITGLFLETRAALHASRLVNSQQVEAKLYFCPRGRLSVEFNKFTVLVGSHKSPGAQIPISTLIRLELNFWWNYLRLVAFAV